MLTQARERLEKAAADMRTLASEIDAKSDGGSVEDMNRLLKCGEEVQRLQAAFKTAQAAESTMDETSSFLKSLADAPNAVKSPTDPGLTPGFKPGDAAPRSNIGKTIGEMFVESQQYKAIDNFRVGDRIPDSVSGVKTPLFTVDQKALITGGSATSAGAAVRNDWYGPITDLVGYRDLTIVDMVTRGQTTSDAIDYVTVTARTSNAGMFAETTNVTSSALKPESSLDLAVQTTNVRTIAHWIPITRRAAADAPQVRTLVDAFLTRGLQEKLEQQILSGAGTGEEFTGILNVSGIQTQDATVGGGGNDFDALAIAISKVKYTAFRQPNAIVVNPLDWYTTDMLLKKESTSIGGNSYAFANPGASYLQNQTMWGLPVIVTPAITQNTALVGDFRQAVLWEREGISTYMTDSHSDFFVRNVLVILQEMRAALAILDPRAFVKVSNV